MNIWEHICVTEHWTEVLAALEDMTRKEIAELQSTAQLHHTRHCKLLPNQLCQFSYDFILFTSLEILGIVRTYTYIVFRY
jgi:hypothetical protein